MSKASEEDLENLIKIFNASDWKELYLNSEGLEVFLSNSPTAKSKIFQKESQHDISSKIEIENDASRSVMHGDNNLSKVPNNNLEDVVVPDGCLAVYAPNLGTFYSRPKPDSPSYVSVGDEITEDTEVCLIEVMKLFTPVKAGVAGTVKEILITDGDMVEFKQPLILIEPKS